MAPTGSGPPGGKTGQADRAYIITGPTSGSGRQSALELAPHGTVVLVGRDRGKLADVRTEKTPPSGWGIFAGIEPPVTGLVSEPGVRRRPSTSAAARV